MQGAKMDTTIDTLRKNMLLDGMDGEAMSHLKPELQAVELSKGAALASSGLPAEYCYFITTGIASVIATSPEKKASEVGLVGWEGVTPLSPILGGKRSAFDVRMQVAGQALRVPAKALQAMVHDVPSIREILNKYIQTFIVQTGFTSLANANHTIEERLARWLLMCHDRVSGDRIPLTHEFLAILLAVRRPSVTTALHVLEGRRFIRSERSLVTVRDRSGLENFARDSYGSVEKEYRELIGEFR